jgi:2-keto-4-pentenoate hydratase/2-oxohepta-3-ene-1,7-dioic acid hydratase in catechol pathway
MKLARCAEGAETFWAVVNVEADTAQPLEGTFGEWAPALTADPSASLPLAGEARTLGSVRLLAPVEPTTKVVAAGATYAKHVAGLGLQMPERPAAMFKTFQSLINPGEQITYPPITSELDYEAELVIVIGADPLAPGDEAKTVLGYTVGNDVTARDLQFAGSVTGMDLFSSKALDDTSGLGPWIVTRDEFGDESPDLELTLTVDGEVRQHDRTGSLVWSVAELLAYVNARSKLRCGDIMFTGTPAGVGHESGRFLEPGQVVEATIEHIGTLTNTVGPRSG